MRKPHPFDQAMFEIYYRAKAEVNYQANDFLKMLTERGGIDTAKYLINKKTPSPGYGNLHELGRLDLTVEAMIHCEKKWHSLFTTEEIEKIKKRLDDSRFKGCP